MFAGSSKGAPLRDEYIISAFFDCSCGCHPGEHERSTGKRERKRKTGTSSARKQEAVQSVNKHVIDGWMDGWVGHGNLGFINRSAPVKPQLSQSRQFGGTCIGSLFLACINKQTKSTCLLCQQRAINILVNTYTFIHTHTGNIPDESLLKRIAMLS